MPEAREEAQNSPPPRPQKKLSLSTPSFQIKPLEQEGEALLFEPFGCLYLVINTEHSNALGSECPEPNVLRLLSQVCSTGRWWALSEVEPCEKKLSYWGLGLKQIEGFQPSSVPVLSSRCEASSFLYRPLTQWVGLPQAFCQSNILSNTQGLVDHSYAVGAVPRGLHELYPILSTVP